MKNTILLIVILFYTCQLMAGWEITQRVSDPDGMINYEVMLIQNNILKYSGNDAGFIIDVNKNELTFFIDQNQTYWRGNPDEFRIGLNSAMQKFMQQMLSQIPEAQREMYSQMLDGMSDMYNTPSEQEIESINIEINATGNSAEIADYAADEYTVNVDDKEVETVWVSGEFTFGNNFNTKKAYQMMNKIRPNADDKVLYEFTDTYLDLISKGYLMKSTEADGETVEVIKVVERSIPSKEMSLPEGYTEVSIDEMLQQQMMTVEDNENGGGW